ncbi:hypothetical protein H9Q73_005163 [Fusarium xylarioides]|nr:hypothetical protein H9Q73_005163 [Fusarium xylarioides]
MHQDLDQSSQHHDLLLLCNDTLDQDKKDVEPVPHARTVSSKNPLLRLLVSDENVDHALVSYGPVIWLWSGHERWGIRV